MRLLLCRVEHCFLSLFIAHLRDGGGRIVWICYSLTLGCACGCGWIGLVGIVLRCGSDDKSVVPGHAYVEMKSEADAHDFIAHIDGHVFMDAEGKQ